MSQEKNLIAQKLFRVRENMENKMKFVLENSDVTFEFILKASVLAHPNEYHNFGHELGAAEQGIRIAIAEGKSREEINKIAFTLLIHDGGHTGIMRWYDEIHSVELMRSTFGPKDTSFIGPNHDAIMDVVQNWILGTPFGIRGKTNDPFIRIVQDADLAHMGLGLPYWLWASMGLVNEFSKVKPITPEFFIRVIQEKFVSDVAKVSGTGKFFLSDGAQKIYSDPLEVVKEFKNLPIQLINYADSVKFEDVTVAEFTEKVNEFLIPA